MLDLPRYLLGAGEILWLAGFALLGATSLRRKLLPRFDGPPAWLATGVLGLALLLWIGELLGSFGLFESLPYLVGVALVGAGLQLTMGEGGGIPPVQRRPVFRPANARGQPCPLRAKNPASGRDTPTLPLVTVCGKQYRLA